MDSRTVMGRPYPAGSQAVSIGGVATHSTQLGEGTKTVRLMSTVDCWIEITATSTNPVANTAMYLPAFSPEYFLCPDNGYVNALQVAAAGTLYVTPIV